MTKDDIKGLLFSLAWCTWSNWHTGEVRESWIEMLAEAIGDDGASEEDGDEDQED